MNIAVSKYLAKSINMRYTGNRSFFGVRHPKTDSMRERPVEMGQRAKASSAEADVVNGNAGNKANDHVFGDCAKQYRTRGRSGRLFCWFCPFAVRACSAAVRPLAKSQFFSMFWARPLLPGPSTTGKPSKSQLFSRFSNHPLFSWPDALREPSRSQLLSLF